MTKRRLDANTICCLKSLLTQKVIFSLFLFLHNFSRSTFTELAKKRARAVNVHLRKSRSENETQSNSMKSFQLRGLGLSRMSDFERSCLHVLCDYKHPPLVPLLSRVSEVGSKKCAAFILISGETITETEFAIVVLSSFSRAHQPMSVIALGGFVVPTIAARKQSIFIHVGCQK